MPATVTRAKSLALVTTSGIDVVARRVPFRVTDDLDAHGTRVIPAGLRLERFTSNPIFCWMHRTGDTETHEADPDDVIGRVVNMRLLDGALVFDAVLGTHDLADRVLQAYVEGRLNQCSISFDPLQVHDEGDVVVVDSAELLEISAVIIGSNPAAIALRSYIEGKERMNPEILKKLGLAEGASAADIMVALCQYLARSDEDKALVDEILKSLPGDASASDGADAAKDGDADGERAKRDGGEADKDKGADTGDKDKGGEADLMTEVKRLHSRMDEMEKRSAPTAIAAAVRAELARVRLNSARPASQSRALPTATPASTPPNPVATDAKDIINRASASLKGLRA
jgi:hypothetical protein